MILMIKKNDNLGQNFLTNKNTIKQIINLVKPKSKDSFLEIGSGKGEITKEIIKYKIRLITLEIDKNLIDIVKKKINNVNILNKDILKFNFSKYYNKKKIRIIGNIPYYISNKILFKLIKNISFIKDIHIMLQKELVETLTSKLGEKKYSKKTIIINYFFKIKKLIYVNKKNFFPIPKVDSIFIKLKPNNKKYKLKSYKNFKHILNNAFNKKKKKIINNLKHILNIIQIKNAGIKPYTRPNKISIKKYCILSNLINNK